MPGYCVSHAGRSPQHLFTFIDSMLYAIVATKSCTGKAAHLLKAIFISLAAAKAKSVSLRRRREESNE